MGNESPIALPHGWEVGYDTQFNLFGDDAMDIDNWMIDPITNEVIPKPIKVYPIIPYRRLSENG